MWYSRFSLEGKVALITGGGRGIGRATALGLAEAGADVAVASRKQSEIEKVAEEIKCLKRKSLAVAIDVGRMEDISKLVKTVRAEFSKIDILVNNAGMYIGVDFLDAKGEAWDEEMGVNLKGAYFLAQAVAKVMKEHGGGAIINVSSINAFMPEATGGIYCISKAGLVHATRVMANELGQYKIRVNSIAPGYTHTEMTDQYLEAMPGLEDLYIKVTPLAHIAEPDEMVGAMIYLASDASSFVTGTTIVVDGGLTINGYGLVPGPQG